MSVAGAGYLLGAGLSILGGFADAAKAKAQGEIDATKLEYQGDLTRVRGIQEENNYLFQSSLTKRNVLSFIKARQFDERAEDIKFRLERSGQQVKGFYGGTSGNLLRSYDVMRKLNIDKSMFEGSEKTLEANTQSDLYAKFARDARKFAEDERVGLQYAADAARGGAAASGPSYVMSGVASGIGSGVKGLAEFGIT
jgi:hypothetical protein